MTAWDTSGIRARLIAASKAIREGAADGVEDVAEEWLAEGTQTVPIEEGTLSRSGQTASDRGRLAAGVGWGQGQAADYAIVQHEDMSLQHDPGRTAKWGERAGVQVAGSAGEIIRNAIQRRLG